MQLDVDGSGTTQLHRIIKAGNALLDIEQVNRKPFVVFTPLPIPHAFYGSNFAEKLVATQNARTVLTRSNPRSRRGYQCAALHCDQGRPF